MQSTLNQVIEWTTNAAEIARKMQSQKLEMHYKAAAELVTEADAAVEKYLLEKIQAEFPDHSINAEESGEQDRNGEHKWYIDPIDGTLNYAHGLPIYCVSVAYAYKGELQFGVISNPAMGETYWAAKGQGAFLNGEPIQVSEVDSFRDSMLITGFRQALIDTPRSNINNFIRLSRDVQTVRRLGSAALDLAYVACGRVEGFWEIALNPWDVAAGILLIREAGGVVSTLHGEGDLLKGSVDILAANPVIFPKLQTILNEEHAKSL